MLIYNNIKNIRIFIKFSISTELYSRHEGVFVCENYPKVFGDQNIVAKCQLPFVPPIHEQKQIERLWRPHVNQPDPHGMWSFHVLLAPTFSIYILIVGTCQESFVPVSISTLRINPICRFLRPSASVDHFGSIFSLPTHDAALSYPTKIIYLIIYFDKMRRTLKKFYNNLVQRS